MTFTKFINLFILQWLCVRLTKHMRKDNEGNYTIIQQWSIQYWIKPNTGWGNEFTYLNGSPKFIYLTKKR